MKKFLGILALAAFALKAEAQISCGTDYVYKQLKAAHPEINEFELQLGTAIKEALAHKDLSPFAKTTATVYDIPIVVHVVHDYGDEYLTDDAIFQAVDYWDKTYNKENSDTSDVIDPFKKYIGNANIRIHLATKDPSGNPTKGIVRSHSYLTFNGGDNAKLEGWPNTQYINIWFVNKFSGDHTGAAAYAYYPSSAAVIPYYDGVICIYSYLNYQKTVPHELGHVLNLAHLWGSTNDPGVACGDDDVDDTPPTMGHTACGPAQLYDQTCSAGYTKGGIDYPDTNNSQNIMDYSYCMKMFTIGQTDRMRAALTSSVGGRNNLYSAANLAATGALASRPDLPPVADLSVEKARYSWGGYASEKTYFLCQNHTGNLFQLTNRSWNDTVTAVEWTFSNGAATPTSTSMGTVANSFTDPGWVTVTMKVTGNGTGTTTQTFTPIYVADMNTETPGYNNYFSSTTDMAKWPTFNYYGNQFKWEYYTGAGYSGSCVRYRSYDDRSSTDKKTGSPVGDYDDMYTPGFDLTSHATGSLNLNFFTAGAYTSGASDSMQIFASSNCGDTWNLFTTLKGSDLANNGSVSGEFIPTSIAQWKGQTINIPTSYRTSRTYFRFRYWPSDKGNNLYFDQFSITPYTTDIKEAILNPTEVKLFPNPSTGDVKLCFTTGNDPKVSYSIKDISGRVIYTHEGTYGANTFVQENIARSTFASAGMYLVTLTLSEQTVTQKLVIQ